MWPPSKLLLQTCLLAVLLPLLLASAGCASCPPAPPARAFRPGQDTPAFPNEMHWVYEFDRAGNVHTRHRDPPPEFALHCFPMTRMTREFFYHAEFDPALPRRNDAFYQEAARAVIRRNSRCTSPASSRVLIPGFANFHELSAAFPDLLRAECGSILASYFQRGNWRTPLPFTRHCQARQAARLQRKLAAGRLPIVHLLEFPMLNHGILLYGVREEDGVLLFDAYDPNFPSRPVVLRYYPSNRQFVLPRTAYFRGGDINVYEVYTGLLY